MNLFEPPPHEPTVFTPKGAARRIGFDVVLGIALGVGAACAFFAANWAGYGPSDESVPASLIWVLYAILIGDALIGIGLSAIAKRWLRVAVLSIAYGWLRVGAFALFVIWAALAINQRLSQVVDRDFVTLVVLSAVLGVMWLVGLGTAWREARSRVTPWIVGAVSLYLAADWAVKLGPSAEAFNDPRVNIAYFTIVGCGAYVLCAILAAMDWVIAWRNRASEANEHG
jgi:hypothetical protein